MKSPKKQNIVSLIKNNNTYFQANFNFVDPIKKKTSTKKNSEAIMINLDKYQTQAKLVNTFKKEISRILK